MQTSRITHMAKTHKPPREVTIDLGKRVHSVVSSAFTRAAIRRSRLSPNEFKMGVAS